MTSPPDPYPADPKAEARPPRRWLRLLLQLRRWPWLLRLTAPVRQIWLWLRLAFKFVVSVVDHFNRDGGSITAGHIAFSILLALFPFLLFLTTIAGYVGQSEVTRQAIDETLRLLPPEVDAALAPAVHQVMAAPPRGLLTVSVLGTLWAATSGLEALREAVNRAYGVETPLAMWWSRLQSLALIMVLATVMVIGTISIVTGPLIWAALDAVGSLPFGFRVTYDAVRYVVSFLMLIGVISVLYATLPNVRLRKREVFPGAMFAAFAWLGTASLFSLYLSYINTYSITYGSLGGIAIALFFFYISAAIFILGAEVNAVRRRRKLRRMREGRT